MWWLSEEVSFSYGMTNRKMHTNEYRGYDSEQSDSEASVILEPWWMLSTLSLLSLPGPLWLGVEAPDGVLSMGLIEVFDI